MSERELHQGIVLGLLAIAGVILASSLFVTAPYGRYARPRWAGPELPSWLAWMVMELPQPAGFLLCFVAGDRRGLAALAFLGMWGFHYTYRTLIYPFLPRGSSMSLTVVASGFALNSAFSYVNGRWLYALGPERAPGWLADPRFVIGALLFFGGFALCAASDAALRRLRAAGERGHKIPRGGAFRWISCPNYLGEIVQWIGWTMASWSLAALTVAAVTAANLVPRARVNHRWCRATLPGYPPERRALIPYLF